MVIEIVSFPMKMAMLVYQRVLEMASSNSMQNTSAVPETNIMENRQIPLYLSCANLFGLGEATPALDTFHVPEKAKEGGSKSCHPSIWEDRFSSQSSDSVSSVMGNPNFLLVPCCHTGGDSGVAPLQYTNSSQTSPLGNMNIGVSHLKIHLPESNCPNQQKHLQ